MQMTQSIEIINRNKPVKRTKFVKKSSHHNDSFILDEALKEKAEALLGIKGYCTNIPQKTLSNIQVIDYYHGLWRVEQAFRISKTDLKTRPIFHFTHDAIKSHVLLCFMGLMMAKFLELKTSTLYNFWRADSEEALCKFVISLRNA